MTKATGIIHIFCIRHLHFAQDVVFGVDRQRPALAMLSSKAQDTDHSVKSCDNLVEPQK